MVSAEDKRQAYVNLVAAGIVIFLMVSLTAFIGYFGSGFDSQEIFNLFNNYGVFGVGSILVGLIIFLTEIFVIKGDEKYGNSVLLASPGDPPSPKFFRFFKGRQLSLILIAGILFSIMGLFISLGGQSFTGEVLVEQQFSTGTETIFKFLLIPIAENAIPFAFGAVFLLGLRIFARRSKMSKGVFAIAAIIGIVMIYGLVGYGNHQLRYGASDLQGFTVFGFWAVGGFITVLTGTFWPFMIMHMANNLFFDLQSFLSNDFTRVFIFALIASQIVLLIFTLRRKDRTSPV